jgi:hypothetical protein
MNSSPLRIGRDRPVASIPSAKGGAINFGDLRQPLLASVERYLGLSTPRSW